MRSVTQLTGMRPLRWGLPLMVLAIFISLAGDLISQEQTADLKSDVLEWVDQLDASSLADRKAAEKSLIEAGPDALQFLPESKAGMSVEATERLSRVRQSLEAQRTKKEARTDDVVIRLKDVATLGEAFEAISRDSGIEFEYEGDDSVAIEPVNTPLSFWHAVDLVLDQTIWTSTFMAATPVRC